MASSTVLPGVNAAMSAEILVILWLVLYHRLKYQPHALKRGITLVN